MKKLFRRNETVITCKSCGQKTEIGYNHLQTESYEKFTEEMKNESLCAKCLMRKKIDAMIDHDPVLIETAKNMIGVGVI